MMKDFSYKDSDWLREHYSIKQWSVPRIAKYCGVCNTTVVKRMRKDGIKRRTRSEARTGELHPGYGKRGPESQRFGKRHTAETKALISAKNIERFKREKHPMLGRHHSEETRRLIGDRGRGRKQSPDTIERRASKLRGRPRPPCSPEWRARIATSVRRLWQDATYRKSACRNRAENSRRLCANPEFLKRLLASVHASPNRPEKMLAGMFPGRVEFTGDRKRWIRFPSGHLKNPDFEVIGAKKVIEVFGDYWHRNDDPEELIRQYRAVGLGCLVIWEHEINDNPASVIRKVEDFLAPS